jgi:hypothetical protein
MSLHLIVEDSADIDVVASALQDAIVAVKTLRFDKGGRYFELQASRYLHEEDKPQRIYAGLRVDGVEAVRVRGIDRTKPESFAVLLSMGFEATNAPGGTLNLTFAGGGEIQMDIELIDMRLVDVGEPRAVRARPDHEIN